MRNQIVIVFVFIMTVAGLFLTNFRKDELPAIPVKPAATEPASRTGGNLLKHLLIDPAYAPSETASPAPAPAGAAVKRSAVPQLPPAETAKPAPKKETDSYFGGLFTISSYAPEEPQADRETFRGPVCIQVNNPQDILIATRDMTQSDATSYRLRHEYAELFLNGACAKYVMAVSPVTFVKDDGTEVSRSADYGFMFFDGTQDPYTVRSLYKIKEEYETYFSAAGQKRVTE